MNWWTPEICSYAQPDVHLYALNMHRDQAWHGFLVKAESLQTSCVFIVWVRSNHLEPIHKTLQNSQTRWILAAHALDPSNVANVQAHQQTCQRRKHGHCHYHEEATTSLIAVRILLMQQEGQGHVWLLASCSLYSPKGLDQFLGMTPHNRIEVLHKTDSLLNDLGSSQEVVNFHLGQSLLCAVDCHRCHFPERCRAMQSAK